MIYTKPLPKINSLRQLASEINNFPINGEGLVQYARQLGYDEDVINFLKLFSRHTIFRSRSHLVYHCSLLEGLIMEENESIPEYLRSAQE